MTAHHSGEASTAANAFPGDRREARQDLSGIALEERLSERVTGTLRRDVVNAKWFTTTEQAQIAIDSWLGPYNDQRPLQGLTLRPPVPETLARNGPDPTMCPAGRKRYGLLFGSPYRAASGTPLVEWVSR